jgi:hypothetical protein
VNIDEFRNDLHHMDEVELKAFGRQHRADSDSVEYWEAQAEWQRRQQKKKVAPVEPPTDRPTSQDFAEMAKAAGPDRYPWVRYND